MTYYGTRGSIPVPGKDTVEFGGNTTCLYIELQNGDGTAKQKLVIDCGTGLRVLGNDLMAKEVGR